MAVTNLTSTSFIELSTAPGGLGADGVFRRALDGDREATQKIAGAPTDQGADLILTADSSAAEAVAFTIPIASLYKLYAATVANVSLVVIRAKVLVTSTVNVAANSYYYELFCVVGDVGGTLTLMEQAATPATVASEGTTATSPPVFSISTTNVVLTFTTTGATAKNVRASISVDHVK